MEKQSLTRAPWQTSAAVALMTLGFAALNPAHAGCGSPPASSQDAKAGFAPAVYRLDNGSSGAFMPVSEEWGERPSIVGLWKFEMHLVGAQNGLPDGALFDWGVTTWHPDGTEIEYSGGRPPSDGNVCMGAWEQIGRFKYKLNHLAVGLDLMTHAYDGATAIRENVTVDPSGNRFSGTFTLTQYQGAPESGTEFDEKTVLYTFTGTVTAKRVTANQ